MDGSFTLEPIVSSGLRGNGVIQSGIDFYSVNLFYSDKAELVTSAKKMCNSLLQEGMICDTPSYMYEREGGIWRGLLQVGQIGG